MDIVLETFFDALGGISLKHGMIRIELVSLSGPEPRVTQRLITSLQAFSVMVQAQNGVLEQLQKAGAIRPPQAAPEPEGAPERDGIVTAVRRSARIEPVPRSTPTSEPAPRAMSELGPPKSPNFTDA